MDQMINIISSASSIHNSRLFYAQVEKARIPKRYSEAMLTEEQCDEINNPRYSYYVLGNVGSGKTHTLCALIRASIALDVMARRWPSPTYLFISIPKLLSDMRFSYEYDKGKTAREWMKELETIDYLYLDDLGVEKPSDWVRETLYLLFNERYSNDRHFTVSSNYPLSKIRSFDPRIGSRIQENCAVLSVSGTDRRT